MARRAACLLVPFLVAACTPKPGLFRKDGFHSARYGFTVCFLYPKHKLFLNHWFIDNFTYDATTGELAPKTGKLYMGVRLVDRDNDGNLEREKVYLFDLKLNHRKTNGVIWIQTFELQPGDEGKELRVLLGNYVSSLSGTGLYAEGNIYSILKYKQKKYAAVIKQSAMESLAGYSAQAALIQIYNIDQFKVDPKHRGSMLKVYLMKLKYYASGDKKNLKTALMLVGYHNTADQFDRYLGDFALFLKNFRFANKPCSRRQACLRVNGRGSVRSTAQ